MKETKLNNNKMYLLYPPISLAERYSSKIGSGGGQHIPLGIFYLASYLREKNYDVMVTDAEAEGLTNEEILQTIEEYAPAYVGISSTTVAFHRALECARLIKLEFPHITIILGGPHITSNYMHAFSYDVFDYGVIGEGEIVLTELLDCLNQNESLENVKGIVYRNQDNNIIRNEKQPYISDLDILPFPAYDMVKDINWYNPQPSNYKSLPVVSIITSRGCPNQCTFCDRSVFGKVYRERSAENVFQEIKWLHQHYRMKEIVFHDDTLFTKKKRIYKLFELLDAEGISFHWTCSSRINNVDYEFLKFVKSKGCWNIAFGIESGDQDILKIIKKNISPEKAEKVINWCHQLKIKTKGFFILGHPGETEESIEKTIRLACKLKIDDVVVTLNTPIPGSPQYAEVSKYGSLDQTDWSKFNMWRPVFVANGLNQELLLTKQKEMYRKFYLRPRIIIRYLLSFFTKGGLRRFLSLFKASAFLFNCGRNRKPMARD